MGTGEGENLTDFLGDGAIQYAMPLTWRNSKNGGNGNFQEICRHYTDQNRSWGKFWKSRFKSD